MLLKFTIIYLTNPKWQNDRRILIPKLPQIPRFDPDSFKHSVRFANNKGLTAFELLRTKFRVLIGDEWAYFNNFLELKRVRAVDASTSASFCTIPLASYSSRPESATGVSAKSSTPKSRALLEAAGGDVVLSAWQHKKMRTVAMPNKCDEIDKTYDGGGVAPMMFSRSTSMLPSLPQRDTPGSAPETEVTTEHEMTTIATAWEVNSGEAAPRTLHSEPMQQGHRILEDRFREQQCLHESLPVQTNLATPSVKKQDLRIKQCETVVTIDHGAVGDDNCNDQNEVVLSAFGPGGSATGSKIKHIRENNGTCVGYLASRSVDDSCVGVAVSTSVSTVGGCSASRIGKCDQKDARHTDRIDGAAGAMTVDADSGVEKGRQLRSAADFLLGAMGRSGPAGHGDFDIFSGYEDYKRRRHDEALAHTTELEKAAARCSSMARERHAVLRLAHEYDKAIFFETTCC